MKVLEIDYDYYQMPENIKSVKEFIIYLNNNYHSFIPMVQYQTEDCVFPYLIEEETKTVYLNAANIEKVCEAEATILCRNDYDARLTKIVHQKCIDCIHYEEENSLKGHREKLSLDGECWGYEKKTD